MATIIRNLHELPTLVVDLLPSRDGGQLRLSAFRGADRLRSFELPADGVGIRPDLSIDGYRGVHFEVPAGVTGQLADALLSTSDQDEPFWLQVGASAGHLGVVPWERFLQPPLGRPLLRVPNFLADPTFLTGQLRMALVVSSPRAKTAFSVADDVRILVPLIEEAVARGTEIHVFADADAYGSLTDLDAHSGHQLHVHDPGDSDDAYALDRFAHDAPEAQLESPWLRWIRRVTDGLAFDHVHFVCPGYFQRDQGALALARTPARNDDRHWSHFVEANELTRFLDLLGAWSLGFSPPHENVWAIGLRLLADRIAWSRPGALFVHDAEHGGPSALFETYRFLFAEPEAPPPVSPDIALYTHPRRMARYRDLGLENFESGSVRSLPAQRGEAIPEQLAMLASKPSRDEQSTRIDDVPLWRQTGEMLLDQQLLRLGDDDTPARRGALNALELAQRILRGGTS